MRLGTAFGVLALLPGQVWACSCAQSPSAKVELQRCGAVFVGKFERIRVVASPYRGWDRQAVQVGFRLLCSWKGTDADSSAVVYTGTDDGTCGYRFDQGETYLVYAQKSTGG